MQSQALNVPTRTAYSRCDCDIEYVKAAGNYVELITTIERC